MERDFVDMDRINALHIRFSGLQNRFVGPDPSFVIPSGAVDRYSRCFVTEASHRTEFGRNDRCIACNHEITVY